MLDHAMRILKDVFGYDAFRGNQAAIIERLTGVAGDFVDADGHFFYRCRH